MERRHNHTSLPNSSFNDSGVGFAPDEDLQIVVPHDVGEVEANGVPQDVGEVEANGVRNDVEEFEASGVPQDVGEVEANGVPQDVGEVEANGVLVLAVQESQYTEDDIHLHPAYSVIFRAVRDRIISLCHGDVDVHVAKAQLGRFRQLLFEVEKCSTCFRNRRGVINSPCMCFCNCLECAEVMFLCSMCGRRIDHAVPAVFQYVA